MRLIPNQMPPTLLALGVTLPPVVSLILVMLIRPQLIDISLCSVQLFKISRPLSVKQNTQQHFIPLKWPLDYANYCPTSAILSPPRISSLITKLPPESPATPSNLSVQRVLSCNFIGYVIVYRCGAKGYTIWKKFLPNPYRSRIINPSCIFWFDFYFFILHEFSGISYNLHKFVLITTSSLFCLYSAILTPSSFLSYLFLIVLYLLPFPTCVPCA